MGSPKLQRLGALQARVEACLEAGALASGCTMTLEAKDPAYADLLDLDPFADLYVANAATLGREVGDHPLLPGVVGSTDMGNVSHLVPSIHPMIQVSPPNVAIHTQDFVRFARGEDGDTAVIDGAKAMAMTGVDLWMDGSTLPAIKDAFTAAKAG